jgi:hypothetical protein
MFSITGHFQKDEPQGPYHRFTLFDMPGIDGWLVIEVSFFGLQLHAKAKV